MKLYISMYHYTRDLVHSRYPGIKGLDLPLFRRQLEFFKKHFNVVRMEDVINAVQNQQKEVLPENPLLLTFDDGYIDNFTFAFPLLEEFGFQLLDVNKIHYILAAADINLLVQDVFERLDYYRGAEYPIQSNEELFKQYAVANRFDSKETIFVKRILQTVLPEKLRNKISSDLFEKYVGISEEKLAYELYMNAEQIRMMKRHGMFIGLHGYDHYWLGNLPIDEMQSDVDNAIDALREFIDEKAWVMNFPYGSYNQDVVQYVKDKGAVLGLTTEVRIAEIGVDNRFTLPRLDCNDFPPKSERFREG